MTTPAVYQLRLPRSIKRAVEAYARADGVSMNQFMATAIAEKLSVLETTSFFEERAARADFDRFDQILAREGGETPISSDTLS